MQVDEYNFGFIIVDGQRYTSDLVLLGGKVLAPWWRKAGGHLFAPEDLQKVIAAAPEVVVLGTGAYGLVRVHDDLRQALGSSGIRVIAEVTSRAVEEYNRLASEGRDVAAALHLTC